MKILVASPIDPDTLVELEKHHTVICAFDAPPETLKNSIQGCEVLIFRSGVKITREVLQSSPDLQLIIRAGSGIDNIDIEYVYQHEFEFVRIPEPGARAVAEMSFAMMLALSRNILLADRMTKQGHWIKHEIEGYLPGGGILRRADQNCCMVGVVQYEGGRQRLGGDVPANEIWGASA